MKLHKDGAEIYVPDGVAAPEAYDRVTHLGIGAHQDDLEIMAYHGILQGLNNADNWFGGVTCTSGSGSARAGSYTDYTDEQMREVSLKEQNAAAAIGQFAFIAQLDYPSSEAKDPKNTELKEDLVEILKATHPSVLYTHNPADKHDTHIGVLIATIQAIRALPKAERPQKVYGCEVWRDLDWMLDKDKVALNVSGHESLASSLISVYDSQVAGGKRYDLATIGRRRANATYFESHAVDDIDQLWFAMDLTPLAHDDELDIVQYVTSFIDRFKEDVIGKLNGRLGY